ncbi:MAG: SpoIID/LytB domain-containing protein [Clostridia bacterium]|nr:SpoIID/LytB domain-containing protein [Clostridia bacterium]
MQKRIGLCLLLCVLLLTVYPLGVHADYTLPQFVRIGLMYGNGAPKSVVLESVNGFQIGKYDGREFSLNQETDKKKLTVSMAEDGISIADATGVMLASALKSVGIKPNASGKEQKLKIDGVEYRGGVDCTADGDRMTVVNVVFLDHYLYGVVSREMSASWHKNALKAQAVCARNYVTVHLDKHASDGFDLCSGVHCQAYSGTRVETEQSFAPVDETTRQVLTYGGKLAELYYSSSMGERTEDVKHVWGNSVPYLISVDNSYEDTASVTNGIWSGTLTCEEATTIMRNKGYDVGDVKKIEVLEYTENGRVLKMEVTGSKGSKVFQREGCRTLFNTVTKSQAFTVKPIYEGGQKIPSDVQITDGTKTGSFPVSSLVILSATGRSNVTTALITVSDGVTQTTYSKKKADEGTLTGFRFDGTGWGHSVGMSQYGAKGMAEAGFDYVEILLHYFPGTNLENAY